jgi:hypothetical protein
MTPQLLCATLGASLVLASLGTAAAIQTRQDELLADAKDVMSLLEKGRFKEVTAKFDAQMTQLLTPDKLEQTWQQLLSQAGAFKGISDATMNKMQGIDVAVMTCEFEKIKLNGIVAYDGEKKISGLRFTPKQ